MSAPTISPPRRTGLIGAAAAVAVVAASAIVVWGLIPLPSFPSLAAEPDASIAGDVAYLTEDGTASSCVTVAAASGATTRQLRCYDGHDGDWADQLAWTAGGQIVVTRYGPVGPVYDVLDPVTGELVTSSEAGGELPIEQPWRLAPDGVDDGITVHHDGGRVVVTVSSDGQDRVVLEADGPRSYRLDAVRWSPDHRHLLALDSEQRVLILDPRGGQARMLAEDARAPTWWIDGHGGDLVVDPSAR